MKSLRTRKARHFKTIDFPVVLDKIAAIIRIKAKAVGYGQNNRLSFFPSIEQTQKRPDTQAAVRGLTFLV